MSSHWCTYCQGHNAHNCQFNPQAPRVQTYTTNNTATPQRQWVGLTPQERDEINEQVYGVVPHHVAFHAALEALLKAKNGYE